MSNTTKTKKETISKTRLLPTLSNHWYQIGKSIYPSSTTILQAYPKGEMLTKWIADQGYEQSKQISSAAAQRGTNVHTAIERLINKDVLQKDWYTLEEWWKINTFVSWWNLYTPEDAETEIMVYSKKHKFAGKFDLLAKVGGVLTLIDFKTSKAIYKNYPLQVASYAGAYEELHGKEVYQTAILQLGNMRNKDGYRYVEYENWRDHYKTFIALKKVFDYEFGSEPPKILELPEALKL